MKKRYCLSLLIIILFTTTSYSQLSFEIIPFPDSLSISALAVNDEGAIFVSTCCSNTDDGIFRSLDNGQTWQCVYQLFYIQDSRDLKINQLGKIYSIINYTLGDSSLLMSDNNGETWHKRYIPEGNGIMNQKLFIDGIDTLFVSQSLSSGVRLLRSTTDAFDWEILFETSELPGEYISDLAVAQNGEIYISLFGFWETSGGVYKSEDNGINWQFLGLQSNQITDLEFNSSGDLLISVRGSDSPTGGLYIIYNGTESISLLYECAGTSGLVVNSSGDIFAGNNWQNGLFHSSDGLTFEYLSPVMPGECPVSNLYLDSEDYLYAIMEYTNCIIKSHESTITHSKEVLVYEQVGIYIDFSNNTLTAFIKERSIEKCSYYLVDNLGKVNAIGTDYTNTNSLQIQLPELNNGIYFLHLLINDIRYSGKFLISNN